MINNNNVTGSNTAVGYQSLNNNVNGYQNVALGYQGGLKDINGYNNTYIGFQTGQDSSANTYSKSTAIGSGATITASNQIVLGTASEGLYVPGKYLNIGGIYNYSSGNALDVSGNANISGINISSRVGLNNTAVCLLYTSPSPRD